MHQLHEQLGHGFLAAKSRAHAKCLLRDDSDMPTRQDIWLLTVRATRSKRLLASAPKRRNTEVARLAG